MQRWRWLGVGLAIGLLPAVAEAQATGAACFRGRIPPTCRSFWLTEAEGGVFLARPEGTTELDYRLGVEVGWMRAVGARSAVGGGIGAGVDVTEFVSLRPRYRRWLSSTVALDLSPGVRWTPGRIETVEARVAVGWRDLAAVWTEVDTDVAGAGGTRWLAGIRSGGQMGLVSYVLGAITTVIVVLSFPRD